MSLRTETECFSIQMTSLNKQFQMTDMSFINCFEVTRFDRFVARVSMVCDVGLPLSLRQ